ncbi:hypothetical protein ID866_11929 [Astraeus odoratus]|nr:hypothetical protein ID866_11929 [Astraeus odoratus]
MMILDSVIQEVYYFQKQHWQANTQVL